MRAERKCGVMGELLPVAPRLHRMNVRSSAPASSPVPPLTDILVDIGLNAIVPVLLYQFSKHYISPSEMTALIWATVFPVAKSVFDLLRHRSLDPIAIVVLLGIVFDGVAIAWGGSPRLLLLRESVFTGAMGLGCFVSLMLRRPLIFYFGRHFMAGTDPMLRERYDRSWCLESVRRAGRDITVLWGAILVGELAMRVAMVFMLPAAWVLVLSPCLLGGLTLAALVWTLRFAGRLRQDVQPLLEPESPVSPRAASPIMPEGHRAS